MQTRYRTRGTDLSGFHAGIDSIAKAFAPPSPQELLYSAQAAKVREDQSRIADLYARAGDPNANMDVVDRQSVIANLYDASNSYAAVRANNAAAGQRNAADNARALEQTRLQQAGESERNATTTRGSAIANAYQPLSPGQVRPEVPPSIASAIGLPGLPATQGLEKPLSETEVRGLLLRRQPLEVQDAAARSAIPREQVQTPQGPRFVYGSDAVGQAPVLDVSGKVQNYATPGGGRGTAAPGPTGRLTDTQTGTELPAGSTVFGAQAQGSPDQFGKTTEAENRDAYAARMTEQATQDILHAFDTGRLPTRGDAALRALAESLPVLVQPELLTSMSPDGQAFYQNVRSALPMQLLTQSGQGVTEREYERKMAELVPVPGEAPSVKAAKRRQFATYAAAVQGLAGRALGKVNAVPAQQPGGPAAATGGYPDGTVIENEAGQRMIRRGGKWEAHNG